MRTGLVTYNWQGPANRLCEKYPVGARVPVFVSISDPAVAVLERGGDSAFLPVILIVAVFFALVGLALLVFDQ